MSTFYNSFNKYTVNAKYIPYVGKIQSRSKATMPCGAYIVIKEEDNKLISQTSNMPDRRQFHSKMK